MEYNAKNYRTQGGDRLVIGGTLEIREGASVTGLPSTPAAIPAATDSALGGIIAAAKTASDTVEGKIGEDHKLYVPAYPMAANQAASTATDVEGLVTDFNALLTKLKTAGLMAADSEG